MSPTGLAVGLARVRYAANRPRFAPGEDLGPPFPRWLQGIRRRGRYHPILRCAVRTDRTEDILARVRATPPGFVRTYGDVCPGAPRVAGAVLHDCHDTALPWHRIVRADGTLAKGDRQRSLLEAEGVPFRGARVDMRVARLPDLATPIPPA